MGQVIRFHTSDRKLRDRAFAIREKVFIEEQQVDRAEEFDAFEDTSIHFLLIEEDQPIATARWRTTEMGAKLERFAVLEEFRGQGHGRTILDAVMRDVGSELPMYMHAQVSAVPFYERAGFRKSGPMFSECNIDHYTMTFNYQIPQMQETATLSLAQTIDHVRAFHDAFKIGNAKSPIGQIGEKDFELRHRLMHEENEEYLQAAREGDLVEIADALGDMLYILCGTILKHGLQYKIAEVFEEIQKSNMSKLDADGQPIYREDGKVMKSDRYFKPDIQRILEQ